MRKALHGLLLTAMLSCGCAASTQAPDRPASILPLRTVRLYETGVGYFERTGGVAQTSGPSLPVPAAHLDDALKTLVVLSQNGGGMVDGLEFDSSVTEGMARALAGLPKEASSTITYLRLLSSLKGEQVVVRTSDGTFGGRVIDVVQGPVPKAEPADTEPTEDRQEQDSRSKPELMLLLFTDHNEIRQFPCDAIVSVRPVSDVAAARLGLALNALSTRAAQSRRMLRVMASSNGPVTLGYIAETPLWRTTYRVVLDGDGKRGLMQGWALLHNDTDEDWRQVRVQLVNGRPDSFLFPMAAPRYGRRSLVTPDYDLSTIPQLLDQTPDAIWGDHADSDGVITHGSGSGSGWGMGRGSGRLIGLPAGGSAAAQGGGGVSDLLQIGNLAGVQQASGVESAALFIYTLPRPLDLRAHGSALVPFAQASVEAQRMTWIEGDGGDARMGVHLVNTTKQTLPPGPIAFFADGGFSGESALDRLKPREARFLQFGIDLDIEASRSVQKTDEEPKALAFKEDRLEEHYVRRDTVLYALENRSGQPRSVHWTLPVVSNANIEGPNQVLYDEQTGNSVAVFEVPARQNVQRTVQMQQGLRRWQLLDALTASSLEALAKVETLPAQQRQVVAEAAQRRRKVDDTQQAIEKAKSSVVVVEKDLERLREHLKALGGEGPGAVANPFVRRILEAEDKLAALRGQLASLAEQKAERREAMRAVLLRLDPELSKK